MKNVFLNSNTSINSRRWMVKSKTLNTVLNCLSGAGKLAIVLLFFLSNRNVANGQCTSVVYYDNMETYTWAGDWWNYSNSGFYTNISVSPTVSAAHYGTGTGTSAIEQDWYVLPNITGLNPAYTYKVKFRLASTVLSSSSAATRGVDGGDFIIVQLSTNGGSSYSNEIKISGNSNAIWDYNATGVAAKTADGTQTNFTTPAGNQYALRPDGYSTVELTLPAGTTQCAVDIYTRVNSAGEDFWIDNVELIEVIPQPTLSIAGNTAICSGESLTLTASGAQTYQWNNGISNGVAFSPAASTTYTVTGTNLGIVNGLGTQNSCSSTLSATTTINQNPTAPTSISGTNTICSGQSTTLTATGGSNGSGASFQWGTGAVGSNIISGQTSSTLTVSPASTTTYWVRRIGNTACSNTTSGVTTTVTVNNPTLATAPTNGDMVWRGASSNDWATIGNWWEYNGTSYTAANAAPTSAQNVVIPANQACVTYQPNTNANNANARNLTIENGATLTMGSGNLNVAGNWVNNGSFVPGAVNVTFAGNGTHTISGSASTHTFNGLEMNKNGEVQLSVPVSINGNATLTNGLLNIGVFDLDLPSNTIIGGSAISYIKTSSSGVLKRNVASSMVNFPVGKSTYNPAELNNSTGTEKFSVRVVDNVADNGNNADSDPTTTMAVVNRTWMIDEEVIGGSDATVRLYWNPGTAEEINGFTPIAAFMAHYSSSQSMWDNIGGAVMANYVETNGNSDFSPFTISSDNSFAPLPVELISFTAQCQSADVLVKWSTASEYNSQYYLLQVSDDGLNWSDLEKMDAAGFSNTVVEYNYLDKNGSRNARYYRLLQFDNDGEMKMYNTIIANCSSNESVFMTFPNPSADAFTVVVNDELLSGSNVLTISDASGKTLYSLTIELENGSGSFALEGLNLPAGLYYLQMNNGFHTSRIIKHSFR